MRRIVLKSGHFLRVDDEDFERVNAYRWCLSGNKHVMRYTKGDSPLGVYVHHFIIGQPLKPFQTDHVYRNPLNNCKENIRHVPRSVNSVNRSMRPDNTSGKTGVYRKRTKWCARTYDGKSLGSFMTKKQAIAVRRNYENANKIA